MASAAASAGPRAAVYFALSALHVLWRNRRCAQIASVPALGLMLSLLVEYQRLAGGDVLPGGK